MRCPLLFVGVISADISSAAGHGGSGGAAVQRDGGCGVLQRDGVCGAGGAGGHVALPVVHGARRAGTAILSGERPHRHVLGPGSVHCLPA